MIGLLEEDCPYKEDDLAEDNLREFTFLGLDELLLFDVPLLLRFAASKANPIGLFVPDVLVVACKIIKERLKSNYMAIQLRNFRWPKNVVRTLGSTRLNGCCSEVKLSDLNALLKELSLAAATVGCLSACF